MALLQPSEAQLEQQRRDNAELAEHMHRLHETQCASLAAQHANITALEDEEKNEKREAKLKRRVFFVAVSLVYPNVYIEVCFVIARSESGSVAKTLNIARQRSLSTSMSRLH